MDGARPRPADVVAVLVAAGLTLAIDSAGPLLPILLATALPVLWMRRAPLTVAWICAGTALALPVLCLLAPSVVPPLYDVLVWPPSCAFAGYAAMRFARHRRTLRWLPVITLALAVSLLAGWPAAAPLVLRTEAVIALAVMYGLYTEVRARLERVLAERAEWVERERLAGEIHDVVTHRVSRMVLQAGALAAASADERGRAAAEELRATAGEALEELRHMVALLRRCTGEGFDVGLPLPDLRSLTSESACAGVPVELVVSGTPVPVSGAVGRTAYRVVQEALANVRDHAPGADARVEVRYLAGVVRISVQNTPPDKEATAFGWTDVGGLHDVRQWVELAGGTLEAGPVVDGGFHVEATLPISPP
ncbi:sensor histidine kinase [Nonomuraea turcica]|uniref:sensor histidine kinase n=1 Tax=Nonomuraea sp. G32 TaxID=3067274 RepID=UPI00273AA8CF|nr:histidine kinase [Nonomuraea sp. G32]MDP4510788.1 histidine kinase [Nonomuraea sp. G32]